MSELNNMRKIIRAALIEERVRKYQGLDNVHIIEEAEEPTRRERSLSDEPTKKIAGPDDKTSVFDKTAVVDKARRPIETGDDQAPESDNTKTSKYMQGGKATPEGLAALKMHTVWNNNLTQIMNFNKGKQLAAKITKRLQNQSGLPAAQMLPIVTAVMKASLEQLDDEVSNEIEQELPGVLDITRS